MNKPSEKQGSLSGIRVLDLSDAKGVYCTKLLAGLGADVIIVEPPGGDPLRNIGPFFHNEPHPERSLYWYHMNVNKRSITLNLDSIDGKEILKKLTGTADILIECFAPGCLDEKGLGYTVLKEVNPRLIFTSITAFGQTGPWSNYKASDIVGLALSGMLNSSGWPDTAPTTIGANHAYHHVSLEAASATLIALYHRLIIGQGQHVDVSMHQSLPIGLFARTQRYKESGEIAKRTGNNRHSPVSGVFPCKDGYIDFRLLNVNSWEPLVKWLNEKGMAEDLKEEKWRDPFFRVQPDAREHIDDVFRRFLANQTKQEVFVEGQKRRFTVTPVNTPEDVAKDPHLEARNFFVSVEHPELGVRLRYLGAPFRLSATPFQIRQRSPLIGEHNLEIYEQELGFSRRELLVLKQAGVI